MEEKAKTKTAEEKALAHEGNQIMNMIIAKTYARHHGLTEEEYLEKIGFKESGKTEEEAIRIGKLNLMVSMTNELLRARQGLKMVTALLKTYLVDEDITEKENKDKEGE